MEQTFFVAGGDARQEAIIHQLKEPVEVIVVTT